MKQKQFIHKISDYQINYNVKWDPTEGGHILVKL